MMNIDFLSLVPFLLPQVMSLVPAFILCVAAFIYLQRDPGQLGRLLIGSACVMVIIVLLTILGSLFFLFGGARTTLYGAIVAGISLLGWVNQVVFAGTLVVVMRNFKQRQG
jgi:hypothetical protein